MRYTRITAAEFSQASGLDGWRVVLQTAVAEFRAGSFAGAAELATAIAAAADEADHHPDLDIRYPDRVRVSLSSHAVHGLSSEDIDLARVISALAAGRGATSSAPTGQLVEIAIDTMDADRIRPFWAAVLGYRETDGALTDPLRTGPAVWFQQMDEPRTERSRFHIDVSVPHDLAEARIAAALAAGGRLISDAHARSWWILADADGNEACICTWQDRD